MRLFFLVSEIMHPTTGTCSLKYFARDRQISQLSIVTSGLVSMTDTPRSFVYKSGPNFADTRES